MGDTIARIDEHPVWGFVHAYWDTKIGKDWDNPLAQNLTPEKPEPGEAAFYELPTTYPVTIVQARYGGIYEGGPWLAFPCSPHSVSEKCPDWNASDVECAEFWHEVNKDPKHWLIGRGPDPELAYYDLIAWIKDAAS